MEHITFFSTDKALCDSWKKEFASMDNISIANCHLDNLTSHDYLVTAGNSYGIMNGGIDLAIRDYFGVEIQDRVQWGIASLFGGCLPVGESIRVETDTTVFPNLIYIPTMITPQPISVFSMYSILYNAFRGMFDVDGSVACCGLGCGTGSVPPDVAAKVFRETYSAAKADDEFVRECPLQTCQ